jgi:hypothetical protein
VSTDAQQKEGTIESQLVEPKKQITTAGHELAEEYIDDGYTGMVLDRPALNRMRADLKTDRFDRIYFQQYHREEGRGRFCRDPIRRMRRKDCQLSAHHAALELPCSPLSSACRNL